MVLFWSFMKQLLRAIGLTLWVMSAVQAKPGPVLTVGDRFTYSELQDYLWHLEDSTGRLSPGGFLKQWLTKQKGSLLADEIPNLGDGDFPHWVGFQFYNQSIRIRQMVVEVDFIGLDATGFYVWENGQLIKAVPPVSWKTPASKRDLAHRVPAFRVAVKPGATYVCGIYLVKKAGFLVTPIQLFEENYFYSYSTFVNLTHGIAVGCLLLAALMGVAFSLLIRQAMFVYYTIYIIGIAAFVLEEQGYLNLYLVTSAPLLAGPNAWIFCSQISIIGHTLFAIKFLKIDRLVQKRWAWAGWVICGFSVLALMYTAGDFILTDALYQWALALSMSYIILAFAYMIVAFRHKIREAYLYLLAAGPLFLSIFWAGLSTLQLVPGGWMVYLLISYSPIWEITVLCMGLAVRFNIEQRQKIKSLSETARLQNQLVKAMDDAQESERQRIAQDLHDDVGNTLATAKMVINGIKDQVWVKSQLPEVDQAHALIEKAGQDLRIITHELMPVEFEKYHLTDAVRQVVERARSSSSVQFDYVQDGDVRTLSTERSLVIYRILSELTNNILKHAGATSAVVQLLFQPENLVIMVEDDGTGFQLQETGIKNTGIGLKNSASRANYIGAKLTIASDSSGSVFIIEVPYG
jgi:signal transduction histidine kinase